MKLQKLFVRNLKYYRKQRKLTQNELTLAIDKGYNYINGIEQLKYFPQPDVIEKISEVLNIQPEQLFSENLPQTAEQENIDDDFIAVVTDRLYERIKTDIRKEIREEMEHLLKKS